MAPRYISNGVPIAVVQAQPLVYKESAVDGIAFMRAPNQEIGSPFTQFEPAEKTMLYVLCGPGASCALAESGEDVTPLLREESLELALYTFKYWPGINSVVALLPPSKSRTPAFLFRRRKLRGTALQAACGDASAAQGLITTGSLSEGEAATVQTLTEGSIFLSSFSQTPNGHTLLLLGRATQ